MNNSVFAGHMIDFCNDNNMINSSMSFLPSDSFTFVSEAWGSHSWLDHAVCSQGFNDIICNITIQYDISDEDHIPFTVALDVEKIPALSNVNNDCMSRLVWDKLSSHNCQRYRCITENLFSSLQLPYSVFCDDINFSSSSHFAENTKFI